MAFLLHCKTDYEPFQAAEIEAFYDLDNYVINRQNAGVEIIA